MSTAADVVRIALSQVGVTEWPPNSNRVKYWSESPLPVYNTYSAPWCASFEYWVLDKAGVDLSWCSFSRFVYTPTLWADGCKAGLRVTDPAPGDMVLFDWSPGSGADHVGFVTDPADWAGRRTVDTVEGNTSPSDAGSQSNGGGVFRRTRSSAVVLGFLRPRYAEAPAGPAAPLPTPKPAPQPAAPARVTWPTLRAGSTGPAVVRLQQLLGIPADGAFGPVTHAAVLHWQFRHNLLADAVVGPQTWASLLAPRPAPASKPALRPLLRFGARGPAVVQLQQLLRVPADGAFGPQTRAAVIRWQSSHKLSADGVVGPATWASLGVR